MLKSIIFTFLFLNLLSALNFDNYNSINDIKRDLKNNKIENKIKFEILSLLMNGKDKDAEFLFNVLKRDTFIYKDNKVLENILYMDKNTYAIVVEKDLQHLMLIFNGKNIKNIFLPCITGKKQGDKLKEGDQKTPEGIYFPKTFIPENRLSKIYGKGAFPLNYPNKLDKQIFKKTGHGIWIHGTNNPNRKPFSSNGCVVLTKKYFDFLRQRIDLKSTPVIILDNINYINKKQMVKDKLSIAYFVYKWKNAWEKSINGSIKEYKKYYSKSMVSIRGGYKEFMKYKKNVAIWKRWIKISLFDFFILKDTKPTKFGNIYVATFIMNYKSNNYKWKGRKILYLIKENNQWKILAEENL